MAKESPPQQRSCGTMVVHERLLRTSPEYMAARARSETHAFQLAGRGWAAGRTGVTVIPVVVHVVHQTNAQNVSDAQIHSQLDVLNRDYRKTNPDVGSTPAVFLPLAADARVEFELATTDPQGNATDGIDRVQTNTVSFSDDDGVKAAATGGADPWPADKYLNIWVCQLGGGLLGYAQFPGGPAATDGVVILHTGFGTSGTAAAPFNLGRTATHEIGHWLNLRHIWGDDGNGCNGDDFVSDTPNAGGPNFGSPAFPHVTCNNGPNGDLFMNYMDYVDDAAMFLFTSGQVTRMQAALDSDRSSIGTTKPGPVTLKFFDDGGTFKFRDDPISLKFFDDGGTFKFRDDPISLKFFDDPGTFKFFDDGGTSPAIDPIKHAGLDKPPGTDQPKGPGSDVPVPQGPTIPFVLSTPHRSMAWTRSFPGAQRPGPGDYEAQLLQYEQLLDQYGRAQAAGQLTDEEASEAERLFTEYSALAEEYYQFVGGG